MASSDPLCVLHYNVLNFLVVVIVVVVVVVVFVIVPR